MEQFQWEETFKAGKKNGNILEAKLLEDQKCQKCTIMEYIGGAYVVKNLSRLESQSFIILGMSNWSYRVMCRATGTKNSCMTLKNEIEIGRMGNLAINNGASMAISTPIGILWLHGEEPRQTWL